MAKTKVQEVTREMGESAGALLKNVGEARQEAQSYLNSLLAIQERIYDEQARREEEARLTQEAEAFDREQAEIKAAEVAQEAAIKAAVLAARQQEKRGDAALKIQSAPAEAEETAPAPEAPAAEPAEPVQPVQPVQPVRPAAEAPQPQIVRPAAEQPHPAPQTQRPAAQLGARPQQAAPGQGAQQRPPLRNNNFQRNAPRPFVPHPDDPNAAANRAKFAGQQGSARPPAQGGYQGAPRQGGYQGGGYQGRPQQGQQGGYQQGGFRQGSAPGGAPRPGAAGGAPGGNRFGSGAGAQRGGFSARGKAPELTPAQEKERVSNYDPNKNAYQRTHDPENRQGKARKAVFKETVAKSGGMDDEFGRGGRKRRKQPIHQRIEPIKIEKAYMTAETITVKDLTERLGKPAGEIIKKLFLLGIMATINQELDYDTAQLVAQEFGIDFELKLEKTAEETLEDEQTDIANEDDDKLVKRAPVVTVMGHVDHGKTSLLDAIRRTAVTSTEAGGITQHIGAYTVQANGEPITFLDTPGHEAFTSMRMRGGQAADIVILVVAADDGIMPQTVEAISHAKAAGVNIIVAINKMDLPEANPDRIKQELTEYELVSEDWGGDTIIVPVSAKAGEGLDTLLDMVLLSAEVMDLKANPDRQARGIIIEAQLDKGRGPVATVLVQNGTLHIGDTIVAGTAYGRVRAMVNDKGERVEEAGPSTPVEVIGFNDVPEAGDTMSVSQDERLSRMVAEERRDKIKIEQMKKMSKASLDDLFSQMQQGEVKDLNLVIKADVQGSVEAVRQAMEKLSGEEVRVKCIHGGVGAITINDVMLASVAGAIIIGFNVRPDNAAREAAEREKVDVRLYRVIYHATEEIQAAMKGMLTPKFKEVILGSAQVRQVFKVTGSGTIAGSYVLSGDIRRNAQTRLIRDGVVVYESKIESVRRFKDDVREVHAGYECGISIENYSDIKEGDVIECFLMEEIER